MSSNLASSAIPPEDSDSDLSVDVASLIPLRSARFAPSTAVASSRLLAYEPSSAPPPRSRLNNVPPIDFASLSPDQRLVIDAVNSGRSVFFTGSAGTGKVKIILF